MNILDSIFDLFFPPKCVCCEKMGAFICPQCLKKIDLIKGPSTPPKGINRLDAVASFKDPIVKKAIHAYKYEKLSAMTPLFADLLVKKIKKEKLKVDIIAFVPISRKRKAWRGFNQSELLALELGRRLKKPVFTELEKVKDTETQVGLGKKAREKNLRGVFVCDNYEGSLKKKRVLLLDDVMTTGTTLSECAKVLRKAGANSVSALVIAKE